jgi:hypothetical protein
MPTLVVAMSTACSGRSKRHVKVPLRESVWDQLKKQHQKYGNTGKRTMLGRALQKQRQNITSVWLTLVMAMANNVQAWSEKETY